MNKLVIISLIAIGLQACITDSNSSFKTTSDMMNSKSDMDTVTADMSDMKAGESADMMGGTAGATVDMAGGSVADMAGGSVADMAGGSVADMAGGNVADMAGGNVADMAGGSVADMAGGNVADMAGPMIDPMGDDDNDGVLNQVDNCVYAANNAQLDGDADGIGDACDNCALIANSNQADADMDMIGNECDLDYMDVDLDTIKDDVDNCPMSANTDQIDTDMDGKGNACDNCPTVPNFDQLDLNMDMIGDACADIFDGDNDGVPDIRDNCPRVANATQVDTDVDMLGNACDNCQLVANADQADQDVDGIGNVCDQDYLDIDLDGVLNENDNCPSAYNPADLTGFQLDSDMDGRGNACDNCTQTPNYDQLDANANGIGDACEMTQDSDNDGIPDVRDNCKNASNFTQTDGDMDGVGDVCDNCVNSPNFNQLDTDHDGFGDACDQTLDKLVISVKWNTNNVDLDLHTINPYGDFFGSNDCRSGNTPNWCRSGLLRDARGTNDADKEEKMILTNPGDGFFTVGVDVYTTAVITSAQVDIYCLGQPVVSFNSGALSSTSLANRTLWEVVRVNPTTCETQAVTQNRSLTCSQNNNFASCTCDTCGVGICNTCDFQCDVNSGACVDPCANVQCGAGARCDSATGMCQDLQCLACSNGNDTLCQPEGLCIRYQQNGPYYCAISSTNLGVDCNPNNINSCPANSVCNRASFSQQSPYYNRYVCRSLTNCQ